MTKEELEAMIAEEEERLGVGSAEFLQRHNEIMESSEKLMKGAALKTAEKVAHALSCSITDIMEDQ